MRKIVAGFFISLDGVVEAPQDWHFPYMNDEMGQCVGAQAEAADAMLFGRATYEEFAAHWSHQGSDVPFADRLNNTAKYVVSTTLETVEWQNSTLLRGDLVEEITELKRRPGKNISISGSATLVRWLLGNGLLDELSLLVHPIVVGTGRRLFEDGLSQQPMTLVESATFKNGVVHLTYQPA